MADRQYSWKSNYDDISTRLFTKWSGNTVNYTITNSVIFNNLVRSRPLNDYGVVNGGIIPDITNILYHLDASAISTVSLYVSNNTPLNNTNISISKNLNIK